MPARCHPMIVRLCMLAMLLALGWVGAAPAAEPADAVDFSRDIRGLLSNRCFRCHGPDEAARKGGLRLDVREAALAEVDSGSKAIVPGHADQSELIARVTSADADMRMPPAGAGEPLKPAE